MSQLVLFQQVCGLVLMVMTPHDSKRLPVTALREVSTSWWLIDFNKNKMHYQQLHLKYLCNLARYWLQAVWGWHDSVKTCSSVIICETIVHLLVTVQNNGRCMVQVLKYIIYYIYQYYILHYSTVFLNWCSNVITYYIKIIYIMFKSQILY